MKLLSKLKYKARKQGLDIDLSDGVKLTNFITKRYIHILPNGKVCSDDLLGHNKALKDLMGEDPFSGSLPCDVFLHVGRNTSQQEIIFSKHCLMQCFENIKIFEVVKDNDLLQHECRVDHEFDLSYKERQALIKACLKYLE